MMRSKSLAMRKLERALRRLGRRFPGKNMLRRLLRGKIDSLFLCGLAGLVDGSLAKGEGGGRRTGGG